jgi:hypothetical protein
MIKILSHLIVLFPYILPLIIMCSAHHPAGEAQAKVHHLRAQRAAPQESCGQAVLGNCHGT